MKDAFYFSHDSNAKDDPKCVLLIEQLGLEGYGIYWVLIETLRDQPSYKYPLILIPALARRYNTTAEKVKAVIGGYGLFIVEEDEFFSLSLMQRMELFDYKKEKAREAGKISAAKRQQLKEGSTDVQQTLDGCSTTVQPVYQSISNHIISNDSNTISVIDTATFDDFWSLYPKKVAKQEAVKAWKKIKPADMDALMNGLDKAKHSEQWRGNTKYIPNAATWLNGRRWEDEYYPVQQPLSRFDEQRLNLRKTVEMIKNASGNSRNDAYQSIGQLSK